jgi:hypothetical protein
MLENEKETERETMHHRQITLADGRYMIFYTFTDAVPDGEETNEQGKDV